MKSKNIISTLITVIITIIVFILIIIGFNYQKSIDNNMCNTICESHGGIVYKVISTNAYQNDVCLCSENGIIESYMI